MNNRAISGNSQYNGRRGGPLPTGVGYRNAWTEPQRVATDRSRGGDYRGGDRHDHHRYHRLSLPFQYYSYYGEYYPGYFDVPSASPYLSVVPSYAGGYDGGPSAQMEADNGEAPAVQAPAAQPDAAAADRATRPAPLGPDSLVEAVQGELARRGYFKGKVDSIFNADTEAALQRFQQDNYLAPTGHLNVATLHALDLD